MVPAAAVQPDCAADHGTGLRAVISKQNQNRDQRRSALPERGVSPDPSSAEDPRHSQAFGQQHVHHHPGRVRTVPGVMLGRSRAGFSTLRRLSATGASSGG